MVEMLSIVRLIGNWLGGGLCRFFWRLLRLVNLFIFRLKLVSWWCSEWCVSFCGLSSVMCWFVV